MSLLSLKGRSFKDSKDAGHKKRQDSACLIVDS